MGSGLDLKYGDERFSEDTLKMSTDAILFFRAYGRYGSPVEVEEWVESNSKQPVKLSALDTQVGGNHYKGTDVQPWVIIKAHNLDFWEGNVIKYVLRKKKNRLEDLKKARHYIDYLIEQEQ